MILDQQKPKDKKLLNCKLTIKDEVNIKVEGLRVETRRKIVNKLKFDLPYARHMPAYKLGRWDGTKTYFNIGGSGYLAHLDVILAVIEDEGYDIEVEDLRPHQELKFAAIDENLKRLFTLILRIKTNVRTHYFFLFVFRVFYVRYIFPRKIVIRD